MNKMKNHSFLWTIVFLWGVTGIVGTVLGFIVFFATIFLLGEFVPQIFANRLSIFGLSVLIAISSHLVGLKIVVHLLSKRAQIAEAEVRHFAISLVVVGVVGFLLLFLSFGILKNSLGLIRFVMGGGAAFLVGVVLFVFGIVWLDKISIPQLSERRRIFSRSGIRIFLFFVVIFNFKLNNFIYLDNSIFDHFVKNISCFSHSSPTKSSNA